MITDEQVCFIRSRIEQSNLEMAALEDDLLDHYCCVTEYHMEKGKSFHDAFIMACQQIAPNGLKEIQDETITLLNSENILIMKRALYFIGLLASMAVSIGLVLRTLSIEGGYELFMGGLVIFGLIFIPLLGIYQFKNKVQRNIPDKLRLVFGFLSALLLGISVLFKIFHLQYSEVLLLTSMVIFSFGFLPFLFLRIYRKALGL